MFLDLRTLGYKGSYDRVAAFGRERKGGKWRESNLQANQHSYKKCLEMNICQPSGNAGLLILVELRYLILPIYSLGQNDKNTAMHSLLIAEGLTHEQRSSASCLVTGASRGIGQAIALRWAADGSAAAVNDAGNIAKVQETVEAIEAQGGKTIAIQADIANQQGAARLLAAANVISAVFYWTWRIGLHEQSSASNHNNSRSISMSQVILVTGASSGFGRLIANALAEAGHTVYASMRGLGDKNAKVAADIAAHAKQQKVDLRTVELDVQSDASVTAAINKIMAEQGRLDVLIHNAGHMVWGPSEAFTPEQLAQLYDINVLGTQRINRAALPYMRQARQGLLIWIGSSSAAGGIPPMLGPYFAAKAGMDALAVCYAREVAPFGIESTIVVPGAFTKGTNHFAHAGAPSDTARASEYEVGLPKDFSETMRKALAATVPDDAEPERVATTIVDIVNAPFGRRPFRVVVDPANDGSAVSYAVIDRVREEFLHRIGFSELLFPAAHKHGAAKQHSA